MGFLSYATPKTLRDFGYNVKDREDHGLGKHGTNLRNDGGLVAETPRTRPGKTHPGGRTMRRVLRRLERRTLHFDQKPLGKAPGSRQP